MGDRSLHEALSKVCLAIAFSQNCSVLDQAKFESGPPTHSAPEFFWWYRGMNETKSCYEKVTAYLLMLHFFLFIRDQFIRDMSLRFAEILRTK